MATQTGSFGGQTISVPTTSAAQAAAVQQFFAAVAANPAATLGVPSGSPANLTLSPTTANVIDTNGSPHVIIGGASTAPVVHVALDGTSGAYATGSTPNSVVVAADNSSSAIVNNSPGSNLVAITGAGPNALAGFAGNNSFTTGAGGQDVVILAGTTNVLTSAGSDAVLVSGPSTITAAAGGIDNVAMTGATTLSFTNNSGLTSTITGAAGSGIGIAGTGPTSVTAGGSGVTIAVNTAAGNVTLTGASGGSDAFDFVGSAASGTGSEVINNFTASDSLILSGYGPNAITSDQLTGAGTVLTLHDGSTITVSGFALAANSSQIKLA